MNETHTTVRGTVITDPTTRRVGDDQVFTCLLYTSDAADE